MPQTNFDFAPPAKTVGGLVCVPIDIQRITASLVFDGATQSGNGDATLEFVMGAQNGNPIFDLRQTPTACWIDGVPLAVNQIAHRDFGGGSQAQLRVAEKILAAGSAHTLRVTYTLGPPQASTAGSYPPGISWSPGPRLAFNFGFTDLGAGRYLESWIPANLIFDQFEMVLELRILNTAISHVLITNGAVTKLGANHWSAEFPARFTALSPLLELRAADSVTSHSDNVLLPVSGKTVSVEAWKLTTNAANLTTQVNNLKSHLAANENSTGPYMHGDRFVAFIHTGGMEYEGGTTSSTGALRHETFHSWWARGLKPASQPDGWWDEAWTVYNDNGASAAVPFNFSDPPVELSPRNPWVRVTPAAAYSAGNRFLEGVAAAVGVVNLRGFMSDFYKLHRHRPATTEQLEAFLVARSGNPQLQVDAFHRFVYGFANPSPVPDLWLRDDPGHTGSAQWGGKFWDSPDLWVRNADDGGTDHQNPEYGQDNWFYARVRNRSSSGAAPHYIVTFNVKPFAGTQFSYPGDFLPCVAAAAGFGLGPGQSATVKARWPRALIPPPGSHPCLLAAVLTRFDHPAAGGHVWEHNNLAQKNLTIVDLRPGLWIVLPFVISSFKRLRRRWYLEIQRPPNRPKMEAALIHNTKSVFSPLPATRIRPLDLNLSRPADTVTQDAAKVDCAASLLGLAEETAADMDSTLITSNTPARLAALFPSGIETSFAEGAASQIPVLLGPQEQLLLGLRLKVPADSQAGEVVRVDVVQRDGAQGRVVGGLAVEIRVT